MEIKNNIDIREYKCGCKMKRVVNRVTVEGSKYRKDFNMDEVSWVADTYCYLHQPNFQKKADKIMHKRNKKRGRGYTKSDKKRGSV